MADDIDVSEVEAAIARLQDRSRKPRTSGADSSPVDAVDATLDTNNQAIDPVSSIDKI